jgi:hypothetical protein
MEMSFRGAVNTEKRKHSLYVTKEVGRIIYRISSWQYAARNPSVKIEKDAFRSLQDELTALVK